ncbi:amino acid transporter [Rhodococcus fascians]|nr:amino acid transporter [Rhodococcus fascians]MBY4024104.1 amino acid transporter [Rhodococcus fascians]
MTSLAAAQSTLTGLGVGLSLIVAIGAQNAFVLRKGLQRTHVFPVVAVCALSDAVLIVAGVAGIGVLVDRFPLALRVVTVLGALFLFVYGVMALNRARTPAAMTTDGGGGGGSLIAAVATCLALTWLNPHVYLDTVVFLGSIGNRQPGELRWWFALGAVLGSVLWFTALGYGSRVLSPLFARPTAWRVLDLGIGIMMLTLAALLLFG